MGGPASQTAAGERIVSTAEMWADPRSDVLVHAAAQLPDEVSFGIAAAGEHAATLEALVSAYGIADRVTVGRDWKPGALVIGRGEPRGASRGAGSEPNLGWVVDGVGNGVQWADTMAALIEGLYQSADPPASCRRHDALFDGHRIAVVTNLPTHYRVPLFNGLAERVVRAGGEFNVLFTSRTERSGRSWLRHAPIEFEHEFLDGRDSRIFQRAPLDLGSALRKYRPTVLVAAGFAPLIAGRAAHYASRRRIPFGIWSGDTYRQRTAHGRSRQLERKWIARRAGFAIAYGWLAREYLRRLMPSLPVAIGRNTAPFVRDVEAPTNRSVVEVLAVAQAIPRKGLDVVIEAFRQLEGTEYRLTIAGGGSELTSLKRRAEGVEQIRFLGAIPSDRVLECYREADIFLFPSRSDVFGLTLVEALGGGLATITAAAPGAVPDLAVDGHNCLIVEEHDPELWARAIRTLADDVVLRRTLAERGRQTVIRRWTMEHSVDAWLAGVRLGLLQAAAGAP